MAAETVPVLAGVMREQRRPLVLWGLALTAVSTLYIAIYPTMGIDEMASMVDNLPEALINALNYDEIGTAAGYISSTVYGLLGPALLLIFAIATGTRLVAGQEEDGTLELELTAPVSRTRVLLERVAALWCNVAVLVAVVAVVTIVLAAVLDLDVTVGNVLAASTGLLLLVLGFGTVGLAAGAITGRRAIGLGVAAGLAVLAFMLNAIAPTVEAEWMTIVSPFSWFLDGRPLATGFDLSRLALLATVPVLAVAAAVVGFRRRDLMV